LVWCFLLVFEKGFKNKKPNGKDNLFDFFILKEKGTQSKIKLIDI